MDIGCGTSEHHIYLKEHFLIAGVDLDHSFIELSKRKNPSGNYTVADMKKFDLKKKYDIVMCLFSSIGYLESIEEIVLALKCFHEHLSPGGLLIVEPWFSKKNWVHGMVHVLNAEKDGIKICRMNRGITSGDHSILNFNYLVGRPDRDVEYFCEEHKLRLTSNEEMLAAFKKAGFEVTFEEKGLIGRGLYFGSY